MFLCNSWCLKISPYRHEMAWLAFRSVRKLLMHWTLKCRTLCRKKTGRGLVGTLLATLNRLSLDALVAHGRDVRQDLRHAVSYEELSTHSPHTTKQIKYPLRYRLRGLKIDNMMYIHPLSTRYKQIKSTFLHIRSRNKKIYTTNFVFTFM